MGGVRYEASFGLQIKTVELSPVNGTGGSWHMYVNRFYWGSFEMRDGKWCFLPQRPEWWFSREDYAILEKQVETAAG